MDPVDMVFDFIKRLFRQRISQVEIQAKSKMYGAQVKAQGAASRAFNDAVDKGIDKAKDRATGARPDTATPDHGQED